MISIALLSAGAAPADETALPKSRTGDVPKYLAVGGKGGQLPADCAVTIETRGTPSKESGRTNDAFQAWRFTSTAASRLDANGQAVATANFAGLSAACRTLLDGNLLGLAEATRGRVTPILTLLGTPCPGGGESIAVTVAGKTVRVDGQNCWTTSFADQKDQQRFDWLYASLRQLAVEAELSRWGTPVNGLELGIAPPWDAQGTAMPLFDGTNVQFTGVLRNSGKAPARLLPSIFMCLLGKGDPLFVSKLVFTPKDGGPALTAAFTGWNHLSLLDKNREGEGLHR